MYQTYFENMRDNVQTQMLGEFDGLGHKPLLVDLDKLESHYTALKTIAETKARGQTEWKLE